MGQKFFVLDTNVLLQEPTSLYGFDEHVIVISHVVLKELEKLKSEQRSVAADARQVIRNLSALVDDCDPQDLQSKGVARNEQGGLLVIPNSLPQFDFEELKNGTNDEKIILDALMLKEVDREVVFVSEDINARLIAKSYGVVAEEYRGGHALEKDDDVSKGMASVDATLLWNCTKSAGDRKKYQFDREKLEVVAGFAVYPNLFIKLSDEEFLRVTDIDEDTVYATFFHVSETAESFGVIPKSVEQAAAITAALDTDVPLVVLTGMAGSGKTIISLAAALEQITDSTKASYKRLIVSRTTDDLDDDIGFLPGNEEEKMVPWLGAFEDNLEALFKEDASPESSQNYVKRYIQYRTVNFMRGRSIQDSIFILDEAQNLTHHQIKSLVTRIGDGSKIIVLGNVDQIDNPYLSKYSSGLTHLVERMQGERVCAHVHLEGSPRSLLAEVAGRLL